MSRLWWLSAASFISPLLQREQGAEGEETSFLCRASGGFPEPVVYWLINFIHDPPEGSVETQATLLPDSYLYNITSHLTANISKESTVTCIVENLTLNQTTTSTSCECSIIQPQYSWSPLLH